MLTVYSEDYDDEDNIDNNNGHDRLDECLFICVSNCVI